MIQSIEQGRKEDGNRSIADKIIKQLHELEMTVENNYGRWAWELLQNAKDSVSGTERKVSVEIVISNDCVIFRHNGTHFSEKDIRGLINQISSKEVEEENKRKQTGKFGTGFLTTHLLSKVVEVKGILETVDREFYRFSFSLNRSGKTTSQLIPKIENVWTAFHESTEGNQIENYDEDDFNTSFTYNHLSKDQKKIAKIGVTEFSKFIPFVLAFIPNIESVKIIDNINNSESKFENRNKADDNDILDIIKTNNEKESLIQLLCIKDDDVAIAAIIEEHKTGYKIQNLQDFPKLFCDFPLIGTEAFHFPVIVNSFYFNPLMERDGVWLKGDGKQEVEENRKILEKAVILYEQLLEKITELEFYDYHNICLSKIPKANEKYFDENWYQKNIQSSLRKIISKSKVVETEDDKVLFSEVRFPDPDLKKEEREKIWKFSSDLKVNTLPAKCHIHKWAELIWKDCGRVDIADLVTDLRGKGNLSELINTLETDESQTIVWLNNCIEFIFLVGGQIIFNDNELIPNQEGTFKKRKELSKDEIEDETLKEIASLLCYNFYEKLIRIDVNFEDSYSNRTIQDVASKITELIKEDEGKLSKRVRIVKNLFLNKGKPNEKQVFTSGEIHNIISYSDNTERYEIRSNNGCTYNLDYLHVEVLKEDRIIAIRKLCEWFDLNIEKSNSFFPELFRKKEKLFVDTIEDKENLYKVLKTKISLSKLAEIAKAIEDDPKLLNLIEKSDERLARAVGQGKGDA